jgi:hypothetical protein
LKTTRERQEERRALKLEEIQQQVTEGSLVIRQMTEEEQKRYAPRGPSRSRRDSRKK